MYHPCTANSKYLDRDPLHLHSSVPLAPSIIEQRVHDAERNTFPQPVLHDGGQRWRVGVLLPSGRGWRFRRDPQRFPCEHRCGVGTDQFPVRPSLYTQITSYQARTRVRVLTPCVLSLSLSYTSLFAAQAHSHVRNHRAVCCLRRLCPQGEQGYPRQFHFSAIHPLPCPPERVSPRTTKRQYCGSPLRKER